MKTLVILTGGTIASELTDGYLAPNDSKKYALLSSYKDSDAEFDVVNPYTILSENLNADYLNKLVTAVNDGIRMGYDSIIIAHGTDTIQYSAAALGFMFGSKNIPIILVSSGYPLGDERSNGVINFECAVKLSSAVKSGVYVCYKNNNNDYVTIHNANKLLLHLEDSENLFSQNDDIIGTYKNKKITIINQYSNAMNLPITSFIPNPSIIALNSLPTPTLANLDGVNAVLIKPYHSSTINSYGICDLCKRANNMGIPIYLAPSRNGTEYESAKVFNDLKINALDMPFASAYVYLWHKLSL